MFNTQIQPRTQLYFSIVTSIFILLIAIAYAYFLSPLNFILDDAYIVLHNVQVLITGHDINYPGVSALNGTTSLLHLALVRVFAVFFSLPWSLYIVTWLAILFYALGLLRLAFICNASSLQTILFLITGLFIGYLPLNVLNGLELPVAFAILIWTFTFLYTKQRVISNILLGLLPFIRPELILLTGIVWLSRIPSYWQAQKNVFFVLRHLLIDLGIICLSAFPFILWYWMALGTPYPETLAAKKYFFAEQHVPFYKKLPVAFHNLKMFGITFGTANFISMLLLMLFMPLSRLFLIFFVVFFLLYLNIFPSALCYNYFRYLYLWLPFMLCGVMLCNQHTSHIIRSVSYLLLILLAVSTLYYLSGHWEGYLQLYHYASEERPQLKNWCEKNIPPGSTILVQDAGFIAYATSFHLIDLVGLKTPTNIRYHQQITFPSSGKKRNIALAAIINATHPDYLIITQEWNRVFRLIPGLQQQGIRLKELTVAHDYAVYQFNQSSA